MIDAEARRKIREELRTTFVVEAAAGTGKTTELVARMVAVLARGETTLGRMIAVTFTEKAAGEMKLRLRGGLEKARNERPNPLLDRALAELEAARIGTIHSLCADLLRERPVEARVDPLFEVSAGDEADRLFAQAFDAWFQAELAAPPEGVRRLLRRRPRGPRSRAFGPRAELKDAGRKLVEHRDFDGAWRRDPWDRAGSIDRAVEKMRELAPFAGRALQPTGWLAINVDKVARFLVELERREQAQGGRDHDGLEAELREVARWKDWGRKSSGAFYAEGVTRESVVALRDDVKRTLDELVARCDADLAACLSTELRPLVGAYERLKVRAGKLDFLDLLIKTRDLVRDDARVRAELQARFTHVFVDEFQDTDPLQAEILILLAADDPACADYTQVRPVPGKIFVVGDPKQSIYRFRRAEVVLYESIKRQLAAHGAEVVYLSTSFRGAPSIQEAVNVAFAARMADSPTQARYVPLAAHRADPPDRPTVVALPVPRPYGDYGRITNDAVGVSYPDAAGAYVDWLIRKSGWMVTEREDPTRPVPLQARHVCLLFKRFQSFGQDVTRPYVRALEARRIPHVLVGGRSFHAREEVLALRNALAAVEWPDDELALFATLRGPFFALGDDALLAWRHKHGGLDPFRIPVEEPHEVADVLRLILSLHRARNRRPIADTIAELLEAARAHAGIAIWPTGEQSLANVLRVLDLARRFEAGGATSFRAFVLELEEDAVHGEAAEAPVVEEGTEGVRIMTVHRAKGLEFPVVLLCDPAAPIVPTNPSRHVDPSRKLWAEQLAGCTPHELVEFRDEVLRRDEEEAVRVAYVAATRARDLLVVPATGDGELRGWIDPLNLALYPSDRRKPTSSFAPGWSDDTVIDRPMEAFDAARFAVAPGVHAPRQGAHRVVWWDPRALELDKEPDSGLRQERLLTADESGASAEAGVRAHAAWRERARAIRKQGCVPTTPIASAREAAQLVSRMPGFEGADSEHTDVNRHGRPRGKRFGALVHAVLAAIPLDATHDTVQRTAAFQGRIAGASLSEVDFAVAAALAALRHPLLARAAVSGDVRREAPILLRNPDGGMIEGVIDLAFLESTNAGNAWTVVEFKTDELTPVHSAQVALYADAIAAATGLPARGVLLAV
jgi:ATP-dependent exoDNAse (exonuclease V) beta subunit